MAEEIRMNKLYSQEQLIVFTKVGISSLERRKTSSFSFKTDASDANKVKILYQVGHIIILFKTVLFLELVSALLIFSWGNAFADDAKYPIYSRDYLRSAMDECPSIAGVSKEQCDCIIATSKTIDENDPVLLIFIESSIDKNKAKILYNSIVYGSTYNNHNFYGIKEKREFLEGKVMVFLRKLNSKCGFSN